MSRTNREFEEACDGRGEGLRGRVRQPPVETRFEKGRSGNPGGRPRRHKKLTALLGEALSLRSGYPNADGTWKTQAETIFASLVAQAAGSDLQAKRLLFEVMVKLHRADICWSDSLPKIELDAGDAEASAGSDVGG